jgi:hypothetical protein
MLAAPTRHDRQDAPTMGAGMPGTMGKVDKDLHPRFALALAAALAAGCTTVKSSGTARSGTEQLLLTGAWDCALARVDFRPLAGRKVFLDPQFVTVTDKDWVISSTRRAMAEQGVLLENNKDHAQVIVEPSFGAYGTDERSCTSGLPQGNPLLPALVSPTTAVAGAAGSSTSAMTLTQYSEQDAVVKAALFAYDAKSGQLLWESGPLLGAQGVRDRYFLGTGPIRFGSLPEVTRYPKEVDAKIRRRLLKW